MRRECLLRILMYYPLFFLLSFVPLSFIGAIFNETILINQEQPKELQEHCTSFLLLDFSHKVFY